MLNIVFLDRSALPAHLPIPRPNFPHHWTDYDTTCPSELLERAKDADIIITSKVRFDRQTLAQLPKLKLIAITATGTNNVDLEAAQALGVSVKNVTDYSTISVAEHVIGLIFAFKRSLVAWGEDSSAGKWAKSKQFCYFDYPIQQIRGLTLGIVGKGSIGEEVGRLAQALGMNVIYAEHKNASTIRDGYLPFKAVLTQADILSLHCPLTSNTEKLIDENTLRLMKPTAFLINTGRGQLIDEDALINALQEKIIAGAAVDVLCQEPPHKSDPLFVAGQNLPNLIITPHIAWASEEAIQILVKKVQQNLEDFVAEQ